MIGCGLDLASVSTREQPTAPSGMLSVNPSIISANIELRKARFHVYEADPGRTRAPACGRRVRRGRPTVGSCGGSACARGRIRSSKRTLRPPCNSSPTCATSSPPPPPRRWPPPPSCATWPRSRIGRGPRRGPTRPSETSTHLSGRRRAATIATVASLRRAISDHDHRNA